MKTINLAALVTTGALLAGCFGMSKIETAQESGNWSDYCNLNLFNAQKGDMLAQTNVGWCYQEGMGDFKKDMAQAIEWYTKAARQGEAGAQANLMTLHVDLPAVRPQGLQ